MGVFYKVRIKVSAPKLKIVFMEGLYVAPDIIDNPAETKAELVDWVRQYYPNAHAEVVVLKRSSLSFVYSPPKKNLENKK